MPRSRGTEMPQRQSPRGPLHLRTSRSNSDLLNHRSRTDGSPRLADGRSPQGAQSDPVNKKKLGTRIADLESQLGQAQEELKSLKGQLASTEAAKKVAQEQLDKKSRKQQKVTKSEEFQEKQSTPSENLASFNKGITDSTEISEDNHQETDVFEVPVEKVNVEAVNDMTSEADQDCKPDSVDVSIDEPEKPFDESTLKHDEISLLRTKLEEREKELEASLQENKALKDQVEEKSLEMASALSKEEELKSRVNQVEKQLEESKSDMLQLNQKLEATERAKEELESEMKKLRVQTEQWRKAADAAASLLTEDVENGRRLPERCGSMDGHVFKHMGGYAGYVGSPVLTDDPDDVYGSEKRKGSGIRMFGDLWKKKGQK